MTIRNLEIYRLAAEDQICPRNFLQMADSDIIVSLHLVVPFIYIIIFCFLKMAITTYCETDCSI